MVSVEIRIEATAPNNFARFWGKTVDKALAASFWNVQEENVIGVYGRTITHTQTVDLAEGPHYVITGNSDSSGSVGWHTKIFINGVLKGEGDVTRAAYLRADFTVGAEPNGEPEPTWAIHSVYRGIEIWWGIPDTGVYSAEVDGVWKYQTLAGIRQLIDDWLGPTEKKPTTVTINVYPTSGTPPYDVMITAVIRSNSTALIGKFVSIYKNGILLSGGNTDAGGKIERTDTVTAESSYYASFAGDSEYEGDVSPPITATIEAVVETPEFKFDSYTPPGDTREIFPVGAPWPSVTKSYVTGEDVYVHYAVKNIGAGAGRATITVKDLDTGSTITGWFLPELAPNARFKTTGSGAYVGKMPSKAWNLEFKVEP